MVKVLTSFFPFQVIARIFFVVNRCWSGFITLSELRRSNLLPTIRLLQEEDDKEFLLVDASLSDLNARVEANEERCKRTSKRLVQTDKRAQKGTQQISDNRAGIRMMRGTIERLKADLRANGIKLSD